MPRRTIRLSVDADERLQSAVKLRGYANPSLFLRTAMDHELKGREETMIGAEQHLPPVWNRSAGRSPGSGEHNKPFSPWWTV
jgi:Arc/MetJ-type ribon-helix-helix transcriptional regulator